MLARDFRAGPVPAMLPPRLGECIHPGYKSLRQGRWSCPGASYFVTFCTASRRPLLAVPEVATALLEEARAIETSRVWHFRCAVVIPEHVHLLFELLEGLPLGRAVARLRAAVTRRSRLDGPLWQEGYQERRLRADDLLPVFLYIILNPYRAKLLQLGERWPWYYCAAEDWVWFEPLTAAGCPFPEWLQKW